MPTNAPLTERSLEATSAAPSTPANRPRLSSRVDTSTAVWPFQALI